jgi:hypothetical protein
MPLFPLRSGAAALLFVLAGCHSNPACDPDAAYTQAVDRPRLQLPGTLSQSERMAPLVIPPQQTDGLKLDPAPRCLDEPPAYYTRKASTAAAAGAGASTLAMDSAEDVVRAWAAAWAEQNAAAVLKLYSPSFQPPGVAGSAEFLDQRREEVTTGPAPAAKVDDIHVTAQSADHRTVAFVQRFGGDRVRKELVLVREGGNWRIVAEKTLETL